MFPLTGSGYTVYVYGKSNCAGGLEEQERIEFAQSCILTVQNGTSTIKAQSIFTSTSSGDTPSVNPVLTPTHAPTDGDDRVSTVCEPFSVSNTDYDTVNYATCSIYACPDADLVLSGCNVECVGDQYFILYNQVNGEVAVNDDGGGGDCGLCAQISFTTTQPCQLYTLHEGCYGDNTCSGQVTVSGGGAVTTSVAPTPSPYTFDCPAYSASNTNNDLQNYDTCNVYACPGASLKLSGCNGDCTGDQYLRLFSAGGTQVGTSIFRPFFNKM